MRRMNTFLAQASTINMHQKGFKSCSRFVKEKVSAYFDVLGRESEICTNCTVSLDRSVTCASQMI